MLKGKGVLDLEQGAHACVAQHLYRTRCSWTKNLKSGTPEIQVQGNKLVRESGDHETVLAQVAGIIASRFQELRTWRYII